MLLRYLTVGVANSAVGLICIWGAMYLWQLNAAAANLVGYGVGFCLSFILNRSWTFAHDGPMWSAFARWCALVVPAYLLNLAVVVAAHRLGGVNPYLAQLLGIAVYTAATFVGSRYFVFAGASAPPDRVARTPRR